MKNRKKISEIETIKLNRKKLDRLFTNTYTKLRPEDLWNIKGLNKKEALKMTDLSDRLFEKQKGNDYLAIKKKNKLSIIRI